MKRITLAGASLLLVVLAAGCNDSNKQEAPVQLVVSNTQKLHTIDLAGDPAGSCNQDIGSVELKNVVVQPATTNTNVSGADLNTINVDRYEVSYVRTDGGKLVPAPFVRSTGVVLGSGETSPGTTFTILQPDTLLQAPFVALLPQNGGVDPETGKPFITMDIVMTFFGKTLAGSRVAGTTRFTLDFCYSCGGCS